LRKIKPKNIIPEIGRDFKKKKLRSKKTAQILSSKTLFMLDRPFS